MSKRVDRLITLIRSTTQNELANSVTDITDDEILQYINEGQNRIQARIVAQHPNVFITEEYVTAVSFQEEYNLPANCMIGGKINEVWYTTTYNSAHPVWYRLKLGNPKYRLSHVASLPQYYWRREKLLTGVGSFVVSPPPQGTNCAFRVVYTQKLDKLDIRRGILSSVTLDTTNLKVTALTLDVSGTPSIDVTELALNDYFCIVDKYGTMQMRNIPFAADGSTSLDATTGIITVDTSFVYQSGESIAVGNYVTCGTDATTHSQLSDDIERYLIQFATYKMFKHDSSSDVSVQLNELQLMEQEIILSYQCIDEDDVDITVTDNWNDFN